MSEDTQVKQGAPERIYTHPTSAEYHVNPWPLEPREYVEYIRADLLATVRREALKDAIGIVKDFQTMTRPNFYDKYKVTTLMAALEASATEKEGMNGEPPAINKR